MLLKLARLKIEASDTLANYIDRDFLLRSGPKKINAFKKHKIGSELIKANNSIDIMAELENKNPEEWVIFRARAIDAGGLEKTGELIWGANDNGDFFSEEELLAMLEDSDKRSFETFIGCPVFVNHENNNVEKARGKIVNAFYDKENHCVWTDGMIDAKAYPELARAVKEGYVTDVSMGCSVKYSHCSYCGHKASTEDEYCLVPDTKITLADGSVKNIQDIEKDDIVLSHKGKAQYVVSVMNREIDEEIKEIFVSGSNIPLKITKNHPVLVLNKMSYRETFDKYYQDKFELVWKNAEDIVVGDYLVSPKTIEYTNGSNEIDEKFARLAGLWLAEGNFVKKDGERVALEFNFSKEEEHLVSEVMNLCLLITGKEAKRYEKDHTIMVRIYHPYLANKIYSSFGEYSREKHITEAFKWNKDLLRSFISGYIDGDGYYFKDKETVYLRTASESIALQFVKILSIFDAWATIHKHENSENEFVQYKNKDDKWTYLISIPSIEYDKIKHDSCQKTKDFVKKSSVDMSSHWTKNGYDIVKVRKISEVPYSGTVYNFEVEEDNSYVANNLAVHNCTHVKNHKGKKLNGKKVYEKNHGIKFIELSAVVDGACENCTIHSVFSGPDLIDKVQEMCKVASKGSYAIADKNKIKLASREVDNIKKKVRAIQDAGIIITARGEDIDKLNKALDLLKEVSRQILESKDVDYEFLADIGDLLSELQNLIVDLVEAGFANQDGPQRGGGSENVSDEDVMNAISDTAPGAGVGAGEATPATPEAPPAEPIPPGQPPVAQPMTTPMLARNIEKMEKRAESIKGFKETLLELENIVGRIKSARSEGSEMPKSKDVKRLQDANELSKKLAEVVSQDIEPTVYHEGPYSVVIDGEGITAFASGKKISRYSNSVLGEDIVLALQEEPEQIAKNLISHIANSKGDNAMEKDLKKEALIQNAPPVEEVQEGQLENLKGNFGRKNDPTETTGQVAKTTEGQLENVPKSKETGKGDWNRVRPNNGKTENLQITEGQFEQVSRPTDMGSERTMSDKAVLEGQHMGIQEWQFSQSGYGSERWDDSMRDNYLPITEGQFEGKDRIGQALNEVQEGQLAGRRQGDTVGADNRGYLGASASDFSDRVVTAFINGLATAVAAHDITPKTLASIRPNSAPIKTAKVSLDGIGRELRKSDIQKIAEYHIARSIGVNQDLADPYIDEVIDVLYSDTNRLASAVKDTVDGRIANLQKVASEEKSAKTIESKVKAAWTKRTAAPIKTQRFVLTSSEITSSLEEGKAPEINSKTINDPAVKSLISNYITNGKGGISITNAQIDESGVVTVFAQENAGSSLEEGKAPVAPSPQAPSAPSAPESKVESIGQESPQTSEPNMQIAASTKEKLKRLAQNPAGTTLPPPGGAMGAPAAGGGPAGGVESLSPPEIGDLEGEGAPEDLGMEEDLGGEAQPFGAISPISGSDDVEFVDGVYKDNTTGVEYTVDVNYRILNPHVLQNPNFLDQGDDEGAPEDDMTEGEDVNDELNANPTGMQSPAIPGGQPAGGAPGGQGGGGGGLGGGLMANAPSWVKTAALRYDITMDPMLFDSEYVEAKNDKGKVVKTAVHKPGHICPQCGSHKVAFASNQGECANCGTKTYVETQKEKGKLRVHMYVDNNLEIREATNEWGGHAFNGPVKNREEILEKVHQILASRKSLVKIAQSLPDDPWLNCVSDQVSDGYDGDNAIQICASLKDAYLKTAMEDDSLEDEEMTKESEEEKVFEDDDSENDSSEETEDFEEVEGPEEEDGSEPDDSFEDDGFEDDGFEEVIDEDLGSEDSGDFGTQKAIDVENITHIDIYGTTPDGEEFEVEIPVNGQGAIDSPIADDDIDILEVEEVFEGQPEDVVDVLNEEGGEEIEDEDYGLKDIFTMPEDPNSIDKDIEEDDDDEDEGFSFAASLRSGRVSTANRIGADFLTDDSMAKLAQALGLSMPTNTKADERGVNIPRDEEEYGLREDGEALDTSEYENTAADMKGTKDGNAAGSSLSEDPAIAGAERGIRQVKPTEQGSRTNKAAGTGSWVKVSGDESKQRKDKHPVEETPNDDGDRSVCEKGKSGNSTESAKKNTNPNTKRTKVHFKEDSGLEVEAGNDGDFDHGGLGKKRKDVHHKDDSKMNVKKKDKSKDKETACGVTASSNPFVKGAQSNNSAPSQTEPVDAIYEDKIEDNSRETSLNIPRNNSKSNPQEFDGVREDVTSPDEIRSSEYDMGQNGKNLHNTGIIPRDKSGDGIGGESTTFEDEKAKGATSGKPDTYVQEFQESKYIDPTPAGKEDNHATMGVNTASRMKKIIEKFASANGFDSADLEAVDFGDSIAIEQLSTGRLFELRPKK